MNNNCRCCGEKLRENINYCPVCGTEVLKDKVNIDTNQIVEKKEEKLENPKIEEIIFYVSTILLLITVILLLKEPLELESIIPIEVMDIIKIASPGILVLNTILLTYTKINYPKSIRTKILFYLNVAIIGYIIIRIIIGLIVVFWIFAICLL